MTRGINGFVPERLSQALAARRLSQSQLSELVGISPPTVSKWLSGKQAPEAETLERMAAVVNVSAEWFTRPVGPPLTTPLFRSNAAAHVAAREMLKARLEWAHDVAAAMTTMVEFPEVRLPERAYTTLDQIDDGEIEAVAAECRALWRLGTGPIADVALALENAGVVLIREITDVAQIEGLSAWSGQLNRPFVYLAADKDNGFRSRFDAAHELGHLCLHRQIHLSKDKDFHNEMERQAHRFAGAFLLPAESFSSEVRLPPTLDNLLLLKRRWGVSVAAMIMRLEALGIIDGTEKLSLFKRRSARWGAKAEPGDQDRKPERPRLFTRTIELLVSSGVLPREHVAGYFGLSPRDIERLGGLPDSYLDGKADVVELARLKPRPSAAAEGTAQPSGATVLTFPGRRR